MKDLPPELQAFAALIETQPQPAREAFNYCLCLMMVEVGKMKQVRIVSSEVSPICIAV